MHMKNRWIGGLLLAVAVALGACAPPGGGQGSSAPSLAPPSEAPAQSTEESMGAEESMAAEESEAPTPTPYDY